MLVLVFVIVFFLCVCQSNGWDACAKTVAKRARACSMLAVRSGAAEGGLCGLWMYTVSATYRRSYCGSSPVLRCCSLLKKAEGLAVLLDSI